MQLICRFDDDSFDACFHFGGINTFGDIEGALSEMARVTTFRR